MKERPILFSTEMVEAILDGRKTQTRRVIDIEKHIDTSFVDDYQIQLGFHGEFEVVNGNEWLADITCPYGHPGDLLYTRESWRMIGWEADIGEMLIEYKDGTKVWCYLHDPNEDSQWLVNQIEGMEAKGCLEADNDTERFKLIKNPPWKPSIHMPKSAARIWLQIDEVFVEGLQDISEEDAMKEGGKLAMGIPGGGFKFPSFQGFDREKASWKKGFEHLWRRIDGSESWEANPWVWVVKYKVLSKTGKPALGKTPCCA